MNISALLNSTSKKSVTWKFRFLFILHLVLQSRNQKNNSGLSTIWFMLNYRGLSYSGIHLLHEFGICPSVNTVKETTKILNQQFQPDLSSALAVYWFDNLRRDLKGSSNSWQLERNNWTVKGATVIHGQQPILFDEKSPPSLSISIFSEARVHQLQFQIANSPQSLLSLLPLASQTELRNPLRSRTSEKFQFHPIDILPIECGTVAGTDKILMDALEIACENVKSKYVFLSEDYDIYWRIHKLCWSRSLVGSYPEVKKQIVLILAPWHIYKNLSCSVWKFFGPLILADTWLQTNRNRFLADADLNEQLPFWIAVYANEKKILQQIRNIHQTVRSIALQTLLEALVSFFIPLVSFKDVSIFFLLINSTDSATRTLYSNFRRCLFFLFSSKRHFSICILR